MSDDIAPSHVITPGTLRHAYQASLNQLVASDSLRRLWAKDSSLWPSDEQTPGIHTPSLGWLDLPNNLSSYMSSVAACFDDAQRDGFQHLVLVATDESHLVMQAGSHALYQSRWRRISFLHSIDPAAIAAIDEQLDLSSTLFVFVNKSGKHIEMHSLFLYFLERLKAQGAAEPGRSFVAVTEAGSYLDNHARSYGFRAALLDPPGVPALFSSLIHLGFLLSGLWRPNSTELAARAVTMRALCQRQSPPDSKPALALAALLAAGAADSHNKLLLLGTRNLQSISQRIAQLVSGSTSGAVDTIIPFHCASPPPLHAYRQGYIAATLGMSGEEHAPTDNAECGTVDQGIPSVSIKLQTPADWGAAMFVWEVATALACSLLRVNPFRPPDARGGSHRLLGVVEDLAAHRQLPASRPRALTNELRLYAEGQTRYQISTLNVSEALRSFFELRSANSYLAIHAFVESNNPIAQGALLRLTNELTSALDLPVTLTAGTRALFCLDERNNGHHPSHALFLILTTEAACDLDIPGAGYTFGQLQMAFAMAEFEALQSRQQCVVRLHLASGLESGLPELEHLIHQALSHTRVLAR